MTESRRHIMGAIRSALRSALLPDAGPERPAHAIPHAAGGLDDFIAEVESLSGCVIRVTSAAEAAQAVVALCRERGWERVLAWDWDQIGCEGLPEALAQAGIDVLHDGQPSDLADLPVGLTGADAALADTGTLVLRHGPGRSPLASLLPPVHVALLDARRLFPDMPSYFETLAAGGGAAGYIAGISNLVFVSGPSRTADIEQTLTLGVHGPRELIVIVQG